MSDARIEAQQNASCPGETIGLASTRPSPIRHAAKPSSTVPPNSSEPPV